MSELSDRHRGENDPFLLRNGDHHAPIGFRNLIGHIVTGELLIDLLFTMDTTQGSENRRHRIIGNQRNTKSE